MIVLTFALLLVCGTQIRAQPCVPDPVDDVYINDEDSLTWGASQNCPDTVYMVRIEADGSVAYEYVISALNLSITFLPLCREYLFTVTPVAQNILGFESSSEWSRTLPLDTDIDIVTFVGAVIDNDLLVQWLVDTKYRYCVNSYELRYWDENALDPMVFELDQQGHLIEFVARCMSYRFEVTSFYMGRNGTTGQFNYTIPPRTNTPSLVDIRQDSLNINTTWSLEAYNENRCQVTALYVNGTRFNATYEIDDTPQRPNVQVSINGLRADSMYYFNVSTDNSAGVSEAFQLAVQTLPLDPDLV